MPITRYYPVAPLWQTDPPSASLGLPATEQSTVFPWGPEVGTSVVRSFSALATAKTAALAGFGTNINSPAFGPVNNGQQTNATTARQSAFVGYGYFQLGAQTIPAGTWSVSTTLNEANLAANVFAAVSVYVWRPSTTSVVGRIYNVQAQLGVEPNTAAANRTSHFTFSGSSVTTQNGDYLIFELHATMVPSMATAYTFGLWLNAQASVADATASQQATGSNWIDSPETLVPFNPGPQTLNGSALFEGTSAFNTTFFSGQGVLINSSASFSTTSTFTATAQVVAPAQALVATTLVNTQTFAALDINVPRISYIGASTINYFGVVTQGSVTFPPNLVAGDLLLLIVGFKPANFGSGPGTNFPNATFFGFYNLETTFGFGIPGSPSGADTGPMGYSVGWRAATGTETSVDGEFDASNIDVMWAQILHYRLVGTSQFAMNISRWNQDVSPDIALNANFLPTSSLTQDRIIAQVTPSANFPLEGIVEGSEDILSRTSGGDEFVWFMAIPTDVTTPAQFSGYTYTSNSNLRLAAVTEISEPDTQTSTDIGGFVARSRVLNYTGTADGNLIVNLAGTTTNVTGPVVQIRIRPMSGLVGASFGNANSFANLSLTGTTPVAQPQLAAFFSVF